MLEYVDLQLKTSRDHLIIIEEINFKQESSHTFIALYVTLMKSQLHNLSKRCYDSLVTKSSFGGSGDAIEAVECLLVEASANGT